MYDAVIHGFGQRGSTVIDRAAQEPRVQGPGRNCITTPCLPDASWESWLFLGSRVEGDGTAGYIGMGMAGIASRRWCSTACVESRRQDCRVDVSAGARQSKPPSYGIKWAQFGCKRHNLNDSHIEILDAKSCRSPNPSPIHNNSPPSHRPTLTTEQVDDPCRYSR